MPEIAKADRPEGGPSKSEEPGIGAKKSVQQSAGEPSPEPLEASASPEKLSQNPEASEPDPEAAEEKASPAFADAAASRPPEAFEEPQRKGAAREGNDVSGDRDEERVFAGWDGLDEIHDLSAEQELVDDDERSASFEAVGAHRSLSEIALTSGALQSLEGSDGAESGFSSKHDELAEAVQAALMSVYGEAPSAAPNRRSLPSPPEQRASGPGWPGEDALSPQDVILNYFDYQPGAGQGGSPVSSHGDAGQKGGARTIFSEAHAYAERQYRPGWHSSPQAEPDYDDLPDDPDRSDAPRAAAEERDSGRLLGAAAIGLVGGIAIAASLAVFVINSYGSGGRPIPGAASQAQDTSPPPGYGRWIKSGAEEEATQTATSSSGAAPVIAAADVSVTPGQPSPLAIEVKPEQVNEKNLVSITGVPEGARLNAGVDAGGGNWLLPPRRLNGLTINVPAGTADRVPLGVQVLDSNVRTPLSEQKQFTIRVNAAKTEPAAAMAVPPHGQADMATLPRVPPESAPAPAGPKAAKPAPNFFSTETVPAPASASPPPQTELRAKPANPAAANPPAAPSRQAALPSPAPSADQASKTEIEDLIREGNKRMKEGDILEARRFYQKAVASGDPEAALAMGRSYDPVYFARIDKKNAEPDAAKAFDWYRKAMDGGAAQTAKVRIENLKHFLNQ